MSSRKITLRVVSCAGQPLEPPMTIDVGEEGATIGRAPGNALVLPDPDRVISRQHAVIGFRDGMFVLCDHGSVVAVQHNGRIVGNGRESPLADGDEMRIGPYVVKVEAENDDETLPLHGLVAGMPEAPPVADTLLSWQTPGAERRPDGITTVIVPQTAEALAAREAAEVIVPPLAAATPAAPGAPSLEAGVTLPLRTGSLPPAPLASRQELLRAFLGGAGMPQVDIAGGLTPEFMRDVGQILSEAVRGILDLLHARAVTKREVRAEGTIIVAADNNPLKFSPDVDAALVALLAPRGRGFMAPRNAVEDAFAGLSSHQQGFVAGMRAVLAVVLARFDPATLEQRLAQPSVADSLVPLHRKARLWDLFAELYVELSRESAADFQALFGHEFLRAYQAQVALARTRDNADGAG